MLRIICVIFLANLINSQQFSSYPKTVLDPKYFNIANRSWSSFLKFSQKFIDIYKAPLLKFKKLVESEKEKFLPHNYLNDINETTTKKAPESVTKPNQNFKKRSKKRSAPEIIKDDKYDVEIHSVYTSDGYHLTLHRIPVKIQNCAYFRTVVMHHGLFGSTDDWLLLGPNKSLPYLLSDIGYDVWMLNARGNKYSRSHRSYKVTSEEFWNFSIDEIGYIDLLATFQYITEQPVAINHIDYIGFCLGATALLILLAKIPQLNYLIRIAIFLAPLYTMYTAVGPMKQLLYYFKNKEPQIMKLLDEKELLPDSILPEEIMLKYCTGTEDLCSNLRLFLSNGGQEIYSPDLRKKVLNQDFVGVSTKTIVHFFQMMISGRFEMYDYGPNQNFKRYKTKLPKLYSLKDVTVSIVILSSSNDWLSSSADVSDLVDQLPALTKLYSIEKNNFTHLDFLWSEDAPTFVYSHIIKLLLN